MQEWRWHCEKEQSCETDAVLRSTRLVGDGAVPSCLPRRPRKVESFGAAHVPERQHELSNIFEAPLAFFLSKS